MTPKNAQIMSLSLIKLFGKIGFIISRQTGSHVRLIHSDGRKITIAIHNKPIPKGTLSSILRQARIDKKELEKLLNE